MGFIFLLCRWGGARLLLAGALLGATGAQAQPVPARGSAETASTAAVAQTVWGILGYTRWPDDPAVLQLCLAGDSTYAAVLLAGAELPGGRRVQARRVGRDDLQPLQGCHVLYAGHLRSGQWQRLMMAWPSGQPLLTLSEEAADCAAGGMFCLDVAGGSVGFELNLDSMARSGVRVNPRVLSLSRRKEGN